MATLEHLISIGTLLRYEADLDVDELPHRYLYVSPTVDRWLERILPGLPRDRSRQLTPSQQVDVILRDFVLGRPLNYGRDHRRLEPHADQVWELKSEDLRLFGWYVREEMFVVVEGHMRKELRPKSAYTPVIERVVAFRAALDMDEPKTWRPEIVEGEI